MKRFILTLLVAFSLFTTTNAQYRYKELKEIYNHKEYVQQASDPYKVGWYECASFFAPGIGQLLSGETWRGLAFIGGEALLVSMITTAVSSLEEVAITNEKGFLVGYTDNVKGKTSLVVMLGALGADLGLAIWSSIDARRIAKVKNMYYQDLIGNKTPVQLGFAPSVSFLPSPSGTVQPNAGLALRMKF